MARQRAIAAFRIAGAYPGARTARGPGFRMVESEGPGPSRKVVLSGSVEPPRGPGWYGLPLRPEDDWTRSGWSRGERHTVMVHPGGGHSSETPDLAYGPGVERAGEFLGRIFLPRVDRVHRAHYARALSRSGLEVVIWQTGGRIEGSVTLTRSGGWTAIHALSVLPELRGRGLGQRILQWALAAADGPVLLTSGDPMISWYERRGFTAIGLLPYFVS